MQLNASLDVVLADSTIVSHLVSRHEDNKQIPIVRMRVTFPEL